MFSPIALQEFDDAKYRDFVQTLTDEALMEEGKQLRVLCGNVATPIVGVDSTSNSEFAEQSIDAGIRSSVKNYSFCPIGFRFAADEHSRKAVGRADRRWALMTRLLHLRVVPRPQTLTGVSA